MSNKVVVQPKKQLGKKHAISAFLKKYKLPIIAGVSITLLLMIKEGQTANAIKKETIDEKPKQTDAKFISQAGSKDFYAWVMEVEHIFVMIHNTHDQNEKSEYIKLLREKTTELEIWRKHSPTQVQAKQYEKVFRISMKNLKQK